jgi:Protein of unknown function (DUF3179)
VKGRVLHFYLAGINNQNFLMRDRETGTWWQQITGKAIFGSLQGATLELVPSDELTFAQWISESPNGRVLAPIAKFAKEYDSNWEPEVAKLPVVISFPRTELRSRDVVVGLTINGVDRAYPWETFAKQSPLLDRVNGTPLLLVVGPDGKSFRAFIGQIDGKDSEFFLKAEDSGDAPDTPRATNSDPKDMAGSKPWALLDAATASEWNFQGCAVSGTAKGKCLPRIPALKDYWFDWRNYHPETTIYKH